MIQISKNHMRKRKNPFIIAEVGVNYYDIAKKENISPLNAAKEMIKKAAIAGADAIKFQTYDADKLASKNSPGYWDKTKEKTNSQYELFNKYDKFGETEYKELAKFCEQQKSIFLSTPFDFESADYLEDLMPFYKISSSDITNIPFIEHIARKQKPVLLSTGASTIKEIYRALLAIQEQGNNDIVIMHCILNYPTKYKDANLGMITHLKKEFKDFLIGYSDHTRPDESMLIMLQAYILGAVYLEKHFTLDKTISGNDHYHAMDPKDLEKLKKNLDFIKQSYGKEIKEPLNSEKPARKFARRSIFSKRVIPKNTMITKDMLIFKRPGTGITPEKIDEIINHKAKILIKNDTMIEKSMIK